MRTRKAAGLLFSGLVIAAAVALGVLTLQRLDQRPRTDDAYIDADVVHLAADVSGRVVKLSVAENQAVKAGDVLFVIDPEPFRIKVEEADAKVRRLAAELAVAGNQVASQNTQADVAQTNIDKAQSQYDMAATSLARLEPLLQPGYVSAERVDKARTEKDVAEVALKQAKQQAISARQSVTSTKPTEEQKNEAQAELSMAQRNLRETEVRAPCDGRVTGLGTAVGEYATAGKPLFTLIDTEHWYAVGNFRETDLAGLAAGQRARVYVLGQPDVPVGGAVVSLGYGVSTGPGSDSTSLPSVSRSLNWVRIAQRFPVRVRLDRPPPDLVRVGASAVVVIEK